MHRFEASAFAHASSHPLQPENYSVFEGIRPEGAKRDVEGRSTILLSDESEGARTLSDLGVRKGFTSRTARTRREDGADAEAENGS